MVLLNDGTRRQIAAAPRLSAGFVLGIDTVLASEHPGYQTAFCASGAIVPDISSDPRWTPLHQAAADEGILACNQVPIVAGNGNALGTLVLFYDKCVEAEEHHSKAVHSLAGLCGLAIEHHQLIARLEYEAVHDPLTGLANRAQLESQLPKWISNSARHDRVLALMMVDLDGFKIVNDTLGHRAGDVLLGQVAKRLSGAIRESDVLVRTGGDEFTLVATEITSHADVAVVADRLIQSLAAPFIVENRELFVSASIGMAVFPNDGNDGAALQRCADSAMFAAKAAGRNRAMRFDPTMGEAALNRLEMEAQLRRAISQNEFLLEYQPQVNRHGEMVGVEALVRWQHPQLGRIPPSRFISVAEQCGLVLSIGSWVLREACRQAMAWQNTGCLAIPVAVNVSALQFQQTDFLEILKATLDETGLPPAFLELELTESLLLANTADAIRKVAAVRDLGVGVAIDDFGTGYSSLAYLQKLPIDRLKIDQSFVREMGIGPSIIVGRNHTAVITAITSLAASLGMRVVAEGVETPAQRDYLLQIGCDTLQGFLFSRPVHADRIEAMLRTQGEKRDLLAPAA
jgi:diguanylate cyclase (GGDEF)-like protein